jgi:hypothetical protein
MINNYSNEELSMLRAPYTADDVQQHNIPVTCPHCNKTGNKPIMKRFHFDYCASNPDRLVREKKVRQPTQLTFAEQVELFSISLDPDVSTQIRKLYDRAYDTTVTLSDQEVINGKLLFSCVPMKLRPMLFRIDYKEQL